MVFAKGIGKPEPLKYDLKSYWSKRINDEHRIIYKIDDNKLVIVSCKDHY
jgi:toxin YoeB